MNIDRQVRDGQQHQAEQDRMVKDTLILQKINASHRLAFADKYPNQVEHILRLITERLQLGLTKTESTDLQNPETWLLSCEEINDLAHAMFYVHQIRQDLKVD
jgi:hypothetical protein